MFCTLLSLETLVRFGSPVLYFGYVVKKLVWTRDKIVGSYLVFDVSHASDIFCHFPSWIHEGKYVSPSPPFRIRTHQKSAHLRANFWACAFSLRASHLPSWIYEGKWWGGERGWHHISGARWARVIRVFRIIRAIVSFLISLFDKSINWLQIFWTVSRDGAHSGTNSWQDFWDSCSHRSPRIFLDDCAQTCRMEEAIFDVMYFRGTVKRGNGLV